MRQRTSQKLKLEHRSILKRIQRYNTYTTQFYSFLSNAFFDNMIIKPGFSCLTAGLVNSVGIDFEWHEGNYPMNSENTSADAVLLGMVSSLLTETNQIRFEKGNPKNIR